LIILVIGDIIGKPGRRAVAQLLPLLRADLKTDMVIANGENAAGGIGLTPDIADELFVTGVDIITTGNHVWAQKDLVPYLDSGASVIRPLNFPPGVAGRGYLTRDNVAVVNLIGRTFMGNFVDCPFRTMDALLADLKTPIIIVDFHAEATSEKVAMGRYLDGRVSALLGTHTHVATADARVLPSGTAYITDIGMVGPIDSIIGDDTESVLLHFVKGLPHRVSVGRGRTMLNAVLLNIDEKAGKARSIERVYREVD
jgi:hypothetical protein